MQSLLTLLPLALAAAAIPLTTRDTASGPCGALVYGTDNPGWNFTLIAYDSASSTTIPIVVGQNGADDGVEYKILSTFASYPYNDYPTMTLVNGVLKFNTPEGATVGWDSPVTSGELLSFAIGSDDPPETAQYCMIPDTDPNGGGNGYPWLAVNGDTDSFYLCSAGDYYLAQTNVVYKPVSGGLGYDYDSCFPVALQMVDTTTY